MSGNRDENVVGPSPRRQVMTFGARLSTELHKQRHINRQGRLVRYPISNLATADSNKLESTHQYAEIAAIAGCRRWSPDETRNTSFS